MILLGVVLLIIGIFAARQILWPIGVILVAVGILMMLFTTGYAYY
jgi:hypothetical protein